MSQDLGLDRSGNTNHWSVTNMTYSDQMLDSPTNNFCVMNPLGSSNEDTYSEGNLKMVKVDNDTNSIHIGTIPVSSGKWYWETQMTVDGGSNMCVGIADLESGVDYLNADSNLGMTGSTGSYAYNAGLSGYKQNNNSQAAYGAAAAQGNIIGTALDLDAGTITFYKNNVSQGQAYSGISGTFTPATSGRQTSDAWSFNFGQDSSFAGVKTAQGNQDSGGIGDFYYTPPTGYKALCTSNLPAVASGLWVDNVNKYFTVKAWTGDGEQTRNITTGFQPDLAWVKNRSSGNDHVLNDVLRSFAAANTMRTNAADSEATQGANAATYGWTDDVGSTYATINKGTGDGTYVNRSNYTYMGYFWKAGGSGSANTDGNINSTVSANDDAGFSIVTYTGNGQGSATIGHGLSKKPEVVIIKPRNFADQWVVSSAHYEYEDTTNYVNLTNAAANHGSNLIQAHDNDTINLGSTFWNNLNDNGDTFVAYCWYSVDNFSRVGYYIGNGEHSGAGPFVYTGFKPAYLLVKRVDSTGNWWIKDSVRDAVNDTTDYLRANGGNADDVGWGSGSSGGNVNFLSNGFKWEGNYSEMNADGGRYFYLCFAETPFKHSNAR